MRGHYCIVAENTAGDQSNVASLDGEDFTEAEVRERAEKELWEPAIYRVLVYQDTGDTYKRLWSIKHEPGRVRHGSREDHEQAEATEGMYTAWEIIDGN